MKQMEQAVLETQADKLVPVASGPAAVLALMAQAVEKGMPVETMASLQAMFHKEQDREAAREFADAMAKFQAECPAIPKSSTAKITSKRTGSTFSYTYAELDEVLEVTGPNLHQRGFSQSWDTAMSDKIILVSCTIQHRNGHRTVTTFPSIIDTESVMNPAQQIAAAVSFGKRQSFLAAIGIPTTEADHDGAPASMERIGPHQEASLLALITEVQADAQKFLKWLGVASLAEIPATDYQRAVNALEQKRRKA